MDERRQIVKAIKVAMAEQDMTPAALAEKTKFSKQMVARMLRGAHDFNIDEIVTLESVLDVTLLLVPDLERVIIVTMGVDTHQHKGNVRFEVTENGRPKKDWRASQLVSTANALMFIAQRMLGMAGNELIENEKQQIK